MATESQLRDARLRARIRQKVREGDLPVVIPDTIQASYGRGCECSACEEPITREQIEYEVADLRRELSLHLACYVLWQIECGEIKRRLQSSGGTYQ